MGLRRLGVGFKEAWSGSKEAWSGTKEACSGTRKLEVGLAAPFKRKLTEKSDQQ